MEIKKWFFHSLQDEEEPEEAGEFKKASEDALKVWLKMMIFTFYCCILREEKWWKPKEET